MCGISGLFSTGGCLDLRAIVAMTRAVAHRGPDGEAWVALGGETLEEIGPGDPSARLALGHRRLSILDLSDAGRQPMHRGPLWVVYNGEIYNFLELRRELEALGERFVSQSDTEVLLAAFSVWGPSCFERFRGMWGMVLVDTREQAAWLCRDRLGIKPLYRAAVPGGLAVVSEIKQLRCAPGVSLRPDEQSVGAYLQTGYEDASRSFFCKVEPFPPGTCQRLDLRTGELGDCRPYWHPEQIVASIADPAEAAEAFAPVFADSVRIHLRSDVPVGCALSGGLDSGAIATSVANGGLLGLMRLQTFSATFPGFALDEQVLIDSVVERVRAEPHEVRPTGEALLEDLDRFLSAHDEPVGSASQYAGFAVARLTREAGVPVTLNGQGGDEVLGGYWETALARMASDLRHGRISRVAGAALGCLKPGGNRELWRRAPAMLRRFVNRSKPQRILRLLRPLEIEASPARRIVAMSESERRIFEIRELTLPRLLKWDDRNFMAFSVESRYPFLDHHVIEICLRMATPALFARGWTKEPLRLAFAGSLPESVLRRRQKVGFEAPQDAWLRGPLRQALKATLEGTSPLWGYADPQSALTLARRFALQNGREDGQALFRLLLTDRWLRLTGAGA